MLSRLAHSVVAQANAGRGVAFGRLTRDWEGRTVFLLGGGPSLRGFDFASLQGRGVVVAINDAFRVAPWASEVFSIDTVWLRNRERELHAFAGRIVAAVPDNFETTLPGLWLHRRRGPWISDDMSEIRTGDNSGFAALGMAAMRGASRIALLGYDMNGPGHFHAGYPWHCRFGSNCYPTWVRFFSRIARPLHARGVRVVNCNPRSAIRCFKFGTVDDVAETPAS